MTEKLQRYKYGYTSDEWGMNSYLGLIPDAAGSVYHVDDVNKAIEALRARLDSSESDYKGKCAELELFHDSHDTALAKLRELEAQEPQPTALTYMQGYSDCKEWALERTLTDADVRAMWRNATIDLCSHENCYVRGALDAQAALKGGA